MAERGGVVTKEIGKTKWHMPQKMRVTVVAQCLGWVFVMPEKAGRPFSIAYAHWLEMPEAEPAPDAEYEAPWTTAHLKWRRDSMKAIDVCGAAEECHEGKCPCALLGDLERADSTADTKS